MDRKTATILIALLFGALLGAALVILASHSPNRHQLVGGQPIAFWLKCLDGDNEAVRKSAVNNLPQFGVAAAAPLIERLDSPQRAVARAAAATLVSMSGVAVNPLASSLRSGTPTRRVACIDVLRQIGKASAPASAAIAAQLGDDDIGYAATAYFAALGPDRAAVDGAAQVLGGTDQLRRLDAIGILRAAPSDGHAVQAMIDNINTTDPEVRSQLHDALFALPFTPPEAVSVLIEKLQDPAGRNTARSKLLALGRPAVAPLAALATAPNERLRLDAVSILASMISTDAADAVCVEPFLDDPVVMVRAQAKLALHWSERRMAATQPTPAPAVGVADAGGMLHMSGPTENPPRLVGAALVPTLFTSLPTPDLDGKATTKPSRISDVELEAAIARLDDPDEPTRASAAALVKANWKPEPSVIDYARAQDPAVRLRGVRLLSFSTDWRKYDRMISATHETDPAVRRAAVGAMGRSTQSPRIVEKLIDLLKHDQSPTIRADAATALGPARQARRVAAALLEAQHDADPNVVSAAFKAATEAPLAAR